MAAAGFSSLQVADVRCSADAYEASHALFLSSRNEVHGRAISVRAEVIRAARFRTELALTLSMVARSGIAVEAGIASERALARSASRYLRWLIEMRPTIRRWLQPIAERLPRPLQRLDALQAALSAAMAEHQAALRDHQRRTVALRDARNDLAERLAMLRLGVRRAFAGRPGMLKSFRGPVAHRRRPVDPRPSPAPAVGEVPRPLGPARALSAGE
jgi:hypothetical protein